MQVFLIAAQTIDGFIGRAKNDRSFDWTSPEDKQFYVSKIKEADVIVMGRRTFESVQKFPRDSRWLIYTSNPSEFKNPKPEVIKAEGTNEDPNKLIDRLKKEGCQKIAICGGSSIYTIFIKAGLIDRLYLTIEPVVFGQGVSLFNDQLADNKLKLVEVERLSDQTVMMEYELIS